MIGKLDEAAQQGASAVILDVDTFGGLASSATDIKDALQRHDKDYVTVGYVHNRALSSGSLITLSCKYIAMAPGGTLGSAQPHPGPTGGEPDPEELSWARKEFSSTAEYRGRNPAIATAWVTAPAPLPSLGVKEGDILTLTTKQAQDNGYCDVVAAGVPDILSFLKLSGATVVSEHLDFWQSAAIWICDPWVTALILGLGLALIIVEMLTLHSWGLAGGIGGVAVLMVFAAHIITGTATWIGLIVFAIGIALLLFETHVLPGHGISAVAGLNLYLPRHLLGNRGRLLGLTRPDNDLAADHNGRIRSVLRLPPQEPYLADTGAEHAAASPPWAMSPPRTTPI